MPIAADRIGNVAINMTSILSTWSFVVKADLTLAYSFSCSNLRLVCMCYLQYVSLGRDHFLSCPWMLQRCLEVHTLFSPSTGWMTVWGYFFLMLLRNGNSSIGKTGIDMVIAFPMPEIERSCCIPWPSVVENHCLACFLWKQMLLWSMYFLCSMFFYVLSSISTETGMFQTPCSLKSCSIAPNTIRIISSCTHVVDCQSLIQSASYVLPMFEIRIPCIHIKSWYPNQANQFFSPCS